MASANMKAHKLGWIGIGRMGYAMAERLARAGCDISVWNRTRAKAEPLAKCGAKVVDALTDLAGCDIVFTMVSTGKDVKEVLFGPNGVTSSGKAPKIVVDSTSISLEESAEIREKLGNLGVKLLAAPVSGKWSPPARKTLSTRSRRTCRRLARARPTLATASSRASLKSATT